MKGGYFQVGGEGGIRLGPLKIKLGVEMSLKVGWFHRAALGGASFAFIGAVEKWSCCERGELLESSLHCSNERNDSIMEWLQSL